MRSPRAGLAALGALIAALALVLIGPALAGSAGAVFGHSELVSSSPGEPSSPAAGPPAGGSSGPDSAGSRS